MQIYPSPHYKNGQKWTRCTNLFPHIITYNSHLFHEVCPLVQLLRNNALVIPLVWFFTLNHRSDCQGVDLIYQFQALCYTKNNLNRFVPNRCLSSTLLPNRM